MHTSKIDRETKEGMRVLSDPKDTLAFHRSRPLSCAVDFSETPCSSISPKLAEALFTYSGNAKLVPEYEAVNFYVLNHTVSLVGQRYAPLEPLPAALLALVNAYNIQSAAAAMRAFYYLLLICIREARHSKSAHFDAEELELTFGEAGLYVAGLAANAEDDALKSFLEKCPDCSLGALCKALHWVFANSCFNNSFGSLPWANVCDCLVKFVTGVYSPEVMLDTVFTLAHNCGAIFNKNHIYKNYEPDSSLQIILDLQRGGQLLTAALSDHSKTTDTVAGAFMSLPVLLMDAVKTLGIVPGSSQSIDWVAVALAGALGDYSKEIDAQLIDGSSLSKYADTISVLAKIKAVQSEVSAKTLKDALAVKEHNKNTVKINSKKAASNVFSFGVLPNETVPILKKRAA